VDELFRRARALAGRSKYAEARKLYRRALKKAGDEDDELACRLALGDTCRMTGDFTEASEHYVEAVSLADSAGEKETAHDARVGLALSRRALGYWKDSLSLLKRAGRFYSGRGDAEGEAFVLWATAGTLRIKGDIPTAYESFKDARKRFRKLGDASGEGYSLCGMGGTARVLGRFDRSLGHYTDANGMFRDLGDAFGTAYSHCGIGNALRMKEDYAAARENFVRASQLYNRIGDIVSYAYTLWSLGKTHMMGGNLVLAYKYTKDARRLFKKTGDPRGLIYAELSVAEINSLKGLKSRARALVREALGEASEWGFQVERCHAEVLGVLLEGAPEGSCYKRLGLKLPHKSIPVNIP
jgi:tetratricopeptide (TPR) repeat protein